MLQGKGGWGRISPQGGSGSWTDTTNKFARKLRDMYRRMPASHDMPGTAQAHGVKEFLAVSCSGGAAAMQQILQSRCMLLQGAMLAVANHAVAARHTASALASWLPVCLTANAPTWGIFQISSAEAERDTYEESNQAIPERHYLNVAAECAVSDSRFQDTLDSVDALLAKQDVHRNKAAAGPASLLGSGSILRLALELDPTRVRPVME